MNFLSNRDPGDENETVENGGSLCVFCREDAALPGEDLCEDCGAEIAGEMLIELNKRIQEDAAA